MQKPTTLDTLVTEEYFSDALRCVFVEWNYRDCDGRLHTGCCRRYERVNLQARAAGYTGLDVQARYSA